MTKSNQEMVWQAEWENELYNIVFSYFPFSEPLSYLVIKGPVTYDYSPHTLVCIAVLDKDTYLYHRVNLDTYSATLIDSCEGEEWKLATAQNSSVSERTKIFSFDGLFPVYKHELTTDAKIKLSRMISQLQGQPVISVSIQGFADSSGNNILNQELSHLRAKSVERFLILEGFRGIPIETESKVEPALGEAIQRQAQRRFVIQVKYLYEQ
ncbi:OmpA family protein [Vibrio coralliilyticus]|uniref:OmpA family protein n=1 Tax=Vibrio coralliilyticus TaxID=190893 RepID=UPI0017DAF745|nr:OmpA family protein [Vibrio coralliilyticus]NUW68061.1 OmpA family protein [Vibrio coralliilyticus]